MIEPDKTVEHSLLVLWTLDITILSHRISALTTNLKAGSDYTRSGPGLHSILAHRFSTTMAMAQMMLQFSPEHEMTDQLPDFGFDGQAAEPEIDIDVDLNPGTDLRIPLEELDPIDVDVDVDRDRDDDVDVDVDVDVDRISDHDEDMDESDRQLQHSSPLHEQIEEVHDEDREVVMLDEAEALYISPDANMTENAKEAAISDPIEVERSAADRDDPLAEGSIWLQPDWNHEIDQSALDEQPVDHDGEYIGEPIVRLPGPSDFELVAPAAPEAEQDGHDGSENTNTRNLAERFDEVGVENDADYQEPGVDRQSKRALNDADRELCQAAIVVYRNQETRLFPSSEDTTLSYLLNEVELIHHGFDKLIRAMREALAPDLDETSEFEIEFEDIGLIIAENDQNATRTTLAQVLSVHRELQLQDPIEELQPCYLFICQKFNFSRRLEFLREAVEAGHGTLTSLCRPQMALLRPNKCMSLKRRPLFHLKQVEHLPVSGLEEDAASRVPSIAPSPGHSNHQRLAEEPLNSEDTQAVEELDLNTASAEHHDEVQEGHDRSIDYHTDASIDIPADDREHELHHLATCSTPKTEFEQSLKLPLEQYPVSADSAVVAIDVVDTYTGSSITDAIILDLHQESTSPTLSDGASTAEYTVEVIELPVDAEAAANGNLRQRTAPDADEIQFDEGGGADGGKEGNSSEPSGQDQDRQGSPNSARRSLASTPATIAPAHVKSHQTQPGSDSGARPPVAVTIDDDNEITYDSDDEEDIVTSSKTMTPITSTEMLAAKRAREDESGERAEDFERKQSSPKRIKSC